MNSAFTEQNRNSLPQDDVFFRNATRAFLQDTLPDQEEMAFIFRSLLERKVSSLPDYLVFLKKTLFFLFLTKNGTVFLNKEDRRKILLKICKAGFFRRFPLSQAMQDIIFFLLQRKVPSAPPKLLSKGCALIEPLSNVNDGPLPDLQNGALLSLFWFLLGKMSGKEEWVLAAFRLASWHLKVLDQNLLPFAALWKEEKNYQENELFTHLFLMFETMGSCFQHEQMAAAAEIFRKKAFPEDPSLSSFYAILSHELGRWKMESFPGAEKESQEKVWLDPDLLLARYSGNLLQSAFTLLGNHSTLGAIHVEDVQIRSFGPQWFPIGDASRFGIVRFPSSKSLLGDLEWKKNENGYSLRGCSALTRANGEEFSTWLEVKNSVDREKFSLDLNFHGDFKERLAFVFFVLAKSAIVEGQMELKSQTFRRYEGPSRKVSFKCKTALLEVRSQNLSCMHLIPLGGKEAYWQSNFLLAYEISPQSRSASFLIERG
jgi:hypothetical protein